jgi:hypothetical protein
LRAFSSGILLFLSFLPLAFLRNCKDRHTRKSTTHSQPIVEIVAVVNYQKGLAMELCEVSVSVGPPAILWRQCESVSRTFVIHPSPTPLDIFHWQIEVYGTKTVGTLERWAPAQPFDFAGWTLLASAPSAERNLYFNLPTIYNAGGKKT